MTRKRFAILAVFAVAVIGVPEQAARADAIDGSWCFKGRHLAIDGPKMLTPGGKTIEGEYDRHGFIYNAPADEREAGATVYIAQLDEESMEFRVGSEQGNPQVWRRCAAPTS